MKLELQDFDRIENNDECLFWNEYGICVHAIKIDDDKIKNKFNNKIYFTGQFHKVYLIEDPFTKEKQKIGVIKKMLRWIKSCVL